MVLLLHRAAPGGIPLKLDFGSERHSGRIGTREGYKRPKKFVSQLSKFDFTLCARSSRLGRLRLVGKGKNVESSR
jgi:hypothetical protein